MLSPPPPLFSRACFYGHGRLYVFVAVQFPLKLSMSALETLSSSRSRSFSSAIEKWGLVELECVMCTLVHRRSLPPVT